MTIKEKDIHKALTAFLLLHLVVWTLVPTISNNNLPLDTIEAIAWGSNLDWGYIKHPPLSAWFAEIFYRIFENQDWAYYLLSQLFVISSFYIVFKFSQDFFKKKSLSLISILLLEGIYFYNFTTPEYNVNVCQLPFLALAVYFSWEAIKKNKIINWLLFGLFSALGVLSKYSFAYLLFAIGLLLIYLITNKKLNFKCLISLISFSVVFFPHVIWLVDNNYTTIFYALERANLEDSNFLVSHLFQPFIFIGKQIGILVPFFIILFFLIKNFKIKINYNDKKLLFLLTVTLVPILLTFVTSLFLGVKIRTMWMTPFYLFLGTLFVYIYYKKISLNKLKYFFSIFLIFFILSPATYLYISLTQNEKRTDYPGKKISQIVQEKWKDNFSNKIGLIGGDEWYGGNLIYHLKPRPKWDNILEDDKTVDLKGIDGGFVLIGEADTLLKICRGVYFELENQGICMIGKKK
tara:strand:- start:2636 stop:4021 length:1386 start_codon:yes stop_codon:yes gene_type:complete